MAHEWQSENNLKKLVLFFHLGVPGIKHRSLGLAVRTFIHWLILTAPKLSFWFTSFQISKSILNMARSLAYFIAKNTNGKIACYGLRTSKQVIIPKIPLQKKISKLNNDTLSDYFGLLTAGPGGPGGPTLSCVHVQAFGRAGHFASSLWNVEKIICR